MSHQVTSHVPKNTNDLVSQTLLEYVSCLATDVCLFRDINRDYFEVGLHLIDVVYFKSSLTLIHFRFCLKSALDIELVYDYLFPFPDTYLSLSLGLAQIRECISQVILLECVSVELTV